MTDDEYYSVLNKNILGDDLRFKFMNHGYYPVDPRVAGRTAFETAASLYTRVMSYVDEPGNLLEVGCGRGGGIEFITKLYDIKAHACDYNIQNLEFCRFVLNLDNVEFKFGSALYLPYDDNEFDTVINIEVGGHYDGKYDEAFCEISRVMKPGAKFVYADILVTGQYEHLVETLSKYFTINTIEDITENVYLSTYYSKKWIQHETDPKFKFFEDIYNVKQELYKTRQHTYYIFELIKE